MRILFSASHFGFLRNFQSTIRLLAERGHELHLVAQRRDATDGQKMADALAADHPSITFELLPSSRHTLWYALATGVRASLDYWRYLDPRWDHAPKLRARAAEQAPALAVTLSRLPLFGTRAGLAVLRRSFRAAERILPPPPGMADVFRRINPDVLLLTPLLYFRSSQVDHLRCARQLGIPSVLGVGSWDHLTTKGLIHEAPDRVLVWNEAQKREAIELHDIPADRVVVTGAQAYDHWFATRPTLDRDAFCRQVALDPQRPILLYLCSSPFIAPYEVGFVRRWIAAIRSSADARLRTAGLLVRPHPQNADQWQGVDLAQEFENVACFPKAGVNPIGGTARSDYFDSMYHSEGVVGVNTSGMLESGIVGRPVYSIKADEFAATQDGTLHFQHLKNVEGGLLHLAPTLDEHVAQLGHLLADGTTERQSARQFIQAFIRPHGLDADATPRVVEAIERLAGGPAPPPRRDSVASRLCRAALAPVAAVAMLGTMEPEKARSLIRQRTRPARLAVRAAASRLTHAWRSLRRLAARMTGQPQLERLAAVEEKVGKFGRAQREELARQRQQLDGLGAALSTRASAEAMRDLADRVEAVQRSLAHQDRAFSDAFERARLLDEQGADDRRFHRRVEELLRSNRPVIVGPWTGEVGFELLYWVPFVRWVVATYGIARERMLVVSRGGVSSWYEGLAGRYADVFSYFSPEEFRAATEEAKKQRRVSAFDAEVVKRVVSAHGFGRVDLIHPGMMYRLFMPFWKEQATMGRVEQYSAYQRFAPVDDPVLQDLPADYVAARFYFSQCFPDTRANRELVESTIDAIGRQAPVVVLNTPFAVDDHRDVAASGGRTIAIGTEHLAPERNLAVQTAVIGRARAFVGTYGGYSYLAPFCGVPSLAFYSARTFKPYHLHAAQRVFERLGGATVVPLDAADLSLVRIALAGGLVTTP
jgi:hypothetical protein